MKVHDVPNDLIVPNTQELKPKLKRHGGVATVRSWVGCISTNLIQAGVDILVLPLPPEAVDESMMQIKERVTRAHVNVLLMVRCHSVEAIKGRLRYSLPWNHSLHLQYLRGR